MVTSSGLLASCALLLLLALCGTPLHTRAEQLLPGEDDSASPKPNFVIILTVSVCERERECVWEWML